MFRPFQILPFTDISKYRQRGIALFEQNTDSVRNSLTKFVKKDGQLDGEEIINNWFSEIPADVFISHSHIDESFAMELAGWLKEIFGITSFIDSCVWGNNADLLALIDNEYCWNDGKETYSYSKRNKSTSHVHMMLATALAKMMDKTECVFFINTENSIIPEPISPRNAVNKQTYSPWIFYELVMIGLLRRRELAEHRPMKKMAKEIIESFAAKELKIQYKIDLEHLPVIDANTINKWVDAWDGGTNYSALDTLYKLLPEAEIINF